MAEEHEAAIPDLGPAAAAVAAVVRGVRDEDLGRPTPCPGTSVAAMLVHLAGLSAAFTAAAGHGPVPGGDQPPPAPDGSELDPGFRESIPVGLADLARAWRDPDAWTGMTRVGGVDLPRQVAGMVALDEVVVHGWDLAVASGQPFDCDPAALEAVHAFLQESVAQNPQGSPGLFGPPVPVAPDAPLVDRAVGLAGRDPAWRPPR